jgi:hypothetical protein
MAENGHLFGGTLADFLVVPGAGGVLNLAASRPVWFYTADSGGVRYEEGLTDLSGATITAVTSDSTGAIPQLRGPEGVLAMWADANEGAGPRRLIVAADVGDALAGLLGRVSAVESYTGLGRQITVYRDVTSGTWPTRPDTALPVHWWDTNATAPSPPTIGEPYARDGVDFYHGRAGA